MTKYLSIAFILIICLSAFNLAFAQTSTNQTSPQEESITGQGSGILEKSLNKIFLTWKSFQDKFVAWWQGSILPKIKQWYEAKKLEVKEELQKEKEELKEEIREGIKTFFSKLWQKLKDFVL